MVGLVRRRMTLRVAGFALCPVLLVLFGGGVFHKVFDEKSAQAVAGGMPPLDPGTQLVFYRCFPNGLPFYLRRTGVLITEDGEELTSNYALYKLRRESPWPPQVVPVNEADRWLEIQRGNLYVVAPEVHRPWLTSVALKRGGVIDALPHALLGLRIPWFNFGVVQGSGICSRPDSFAG